MKNKITIIGSGAMATATSKILYDSGNKNIIIYGIDNNELKELNNGKNIKYFPLNSKIPNFKTTTNLKKALNNSSYVVLAIPSQFIDNVYQKILKLLNSNVVIISVVKGFYPNTNYSIHEGLKKKSINNNFVKGIISLIGPSHAEEIVKETPTIIAVVGENINLLKNIQKIFYCSYFKTYRQTDIKGAGIGAAYKNILAIASGISSGLGYGINTTAALLTRGIAEMIRFNDFIGGKKDTIIGLTGIGDLIVTAMSDLSRNFSFGKEFIKNKKNALNSKKTIEGLVALKHLYNFSKNQKIHLPIVKILYESIFKNKNPKDLLEKFWKTNFKKE